MDLSEEEWTMLTPLIPPVKPGGRPRTTDMRDVLKAIFYLLRSGGAWRMLPQEFPAWQTVYDYFRHWPRAQARFSGPLGINDCLHLEGWTHRQ
jgi:putative transposase